MRGAGVIVVAVASLAVGGAAGFSMGQQPSAADAERHGERRERIESSAQERSGGAGGAGAGTNEAGRSTRHRVEHPRRRLGGRSDRGSDPASLGADDPADDAAAADALEDQDPERLAQELSACIEDQVELLGRPIEMPGEPEDRFTSQSVSTGVRGAMDQAGVAGEVEATDCSEHPCIVFGRLEGDEEDMEKIERAQALAPYESDVLSLLFWATSADDPSAPARETGLFALAFYTDADRQELGDALDRRIRARVMEYWNTDKPGRLPAPE